MNVIVDYENGKPAVVYDNVEFLNLWTKEDLMRFLTVEHLDESRLPDILKLLKTRASIAELMRDLYVLS